MSYEEVVLVDENDREVGTMEKMEAHRKGLLHRAFSVFIFNEKGEMLLQQRALSKYHSGGLWTNTCCSHPRQGEPVLKAAKRRLVEEMGLNCEIDSAFSFTYKAHLDNDLVEHELDHVFTGTSNHTPLLNPDEAASYKYIAPTDLLKWVDEEPEAFTAWFKICLPRVIKELKLA